MAGYYQDEEDYPGPYRASRGDEFETRRAEEPHRGAPPQFDTRGMGPGPQRVPQFETMNVQAPVRMQDPHPSKLGQQDYGAGGRGTGSTPLNAPTHVETQKPHSASHGGRIPSWMLITSLCLRVAAALALIVALAILAANSKTVASLDGTISSTSFSATKYALAVAIIGAVYSLYETVSSVVRLVMGHLLLPGKLSLIVSYVGDQIVIVLLLTGGSAGAAFLKDVHDIDANGGGSACDALDNFCEQGAGGVAMIFIGFCFLAASLVISSFCLYKNKT